MGVLYLLSEPLGARREVLLEPRQDRLAWAYPPRRDGVSGGRADYAGAGQPVAAQALGALRGLCP